MISKTSKLSLSVALIFSALLHALLIFIITFVNPEPKMAKKESPKVMDVVLFDPRTVPKKTVENDDAKTISNRTVKGNPKQAQDKMSRRAKAPPPSKQKQKKQPKPEESKQEKAEKVQPKKRDKRTPTLTREVTKSEMNPEAKIKVEKSFLDKVLKPTRNIPMANLIPSSMALSELSRDFERERRLKQMLSNEADIPINTREAKYAPYAHALISSLEEQWRPDKVDYTHFREQERQVLMRLTIEYNGELGGLELLRGSPIPSLNESAVKAIHAAAPFKPLPRSWGLDRAKFYLTFEVIDDKLVFKTL